MRMRHPLDDILGRRSKVALLRYLVTSRRETTGRDLARSVGIDHKACLGSLADLVREGIVWQRAVGRAWFFRLNGDFPLVRDALAPLFAWEGGLFERMAGDALACLGPAALSVFLFGSTAKESDTAVSDVDFLVVARDKSDIPDLEEKGLDAKELLVKNYNRVPNHLFMDVPEFRRRYLKNEYFLMEILRSGRHLGGLRVEELLNRGRAKDRRRKRPAR